MGKFFKGLMILLVMVLCSHFFVACNEPIYSLRFMVGEEEYYTYATKGHALVELPDNPTLEDHTFEGWYWDKDVWNDPFTINYLLNTPLLSDLKIYAKFVVVHEHTLTHVEYKAPTCTKNGNTEHWLCTICNEEFLDSEGKTELSGGAVLLATNHDLSDWIVETEATCIKTGQNIRVCLTCEEVLETEITYGVDNHKRVSDWAEVIHPSCSVEGRRQKTCLDCFKPLESETIAKLPHMFDDWYETKAPTYVAVGEEQRDCHNCSHHETRDVAILSSEVTVPTSIVIKNGILEWDGHSPFGYELVVNGTTSRILDNTYEPELSSTEYNSAKVAAIYIDSTRSEYVELNDFIINEPISNLHFTESDGIVTFAWDSETNLYDYVVTIDGEENTCSKSNNMITVPRADLMSGSKVSVYVEGIPQLNLFESKITSLTLESLAAPEVAIDGLMIKWDSVENATSYHVVADTTVDSDITSYSYEGLESGEHTIVVQAIGDGYLSNTTSFSFIKLQDPTIEVDRNDISWEPVPGQLRYSVTYNDLETITTQGCYTIDDITLGKTVYIYACPVTKGTMQSDVCVVNVFGDDNGYTTYIGSVCDSEPCFNQVNVIGDYLYVPIEVGDKADYSAITDKYILVANMYPSTLSKDSVDYLIVPSYFGSIAEGSFDSCSNLKTVTIDKDIVSIGAGAFEGCSSLTKITIPFVGGGEGMPTFFGYIFGAPTECDDPYYVPESLAEVVVTGGTRIQYYDFYCCTNLKKIVIGEAVEEISYAAFEGCESLESITVPVIGDLAYGNYTHFGTIFDSWCTTGTGQGNYIPQNLKEVIITKVTTIPASAFEGCATVVSITLPDTLITIEDNAFINCKSLKSITIPKSVTSIGDYAFYGCENLETVTFEEGSVCTTIGDYAFAGCTKLSSITFPDSVTSIGEGVISGNTSLASLTIPFVGNGDETTYFGHIFGALGDYENADYVPASLKTVVITGGDKIDDYAFQNCNYIERISIPASVTYIGDYAFSECVKLESITFEENSMCDSIGALAFYGCSAVSSFTVPASVTYIGEGAFSESAGFENVYFDESSEPLTFGDSLFYNNTGLLEITIPARATNISAYMFAESWPEFISFERNSSCTYIGNNAFYNCIFLHNTYISAGVTSIGDYAYYGCEELDAVTFDKDSVCTTIGDYAFAGCTKLSSITFPDCVTSIGKGVISGNTSLASLTIPFVGEGTEDNGYIGYMFGADSYDDQEDYLHQNLTTIVITGGDYIYEGAFQSCSYIESITIPASVTQIQDFAFSNCSGLTEVIFESGSLCRDISDYSFASCSSLKSITIPSRVTGIGAAAFSGCTSLETVSLSASLEYIMDSAFYGCSKLASISIPDGVIEINNEVFRDTIITEISIPDSVTYLSKGVLYGMKKLESLEVPFLGSDSETYTTLGYFFGANDYNGHTTRIPATLKTVVITGGNTIEEYAFYMCEHIESVTLPETVTSIGDFAFSSCFVLKTVNIPSGVTSIGSSAFYSCNTLESITLPTGLTTISNSAFWDCSSLKSLTIPATVESIEDFAFEYCLGVETLTFETASQCTNIGAFAFSHCQNITTLTIPASVTTIGDYAFSECIVINNIYFDSSNNPLTFGVYVFYKNTALGEITIPARATNIGASMFEESVPDFISFERGSNCTTIGDRAFYNSRLIRSFYIPASVIAIGDYAFYGCESLEEVTFGEDSVCTTIGDYAFANCPNLLEISFPDSVTNMGVGAISGNTSLASLTTPFVGGGTEDNSYIGYMFSGGNESIPSSLKTVTITNSETIYKDALMGCSNITRVDITSNITSIGDCAFYGCGVSTISLPNSLTTIGNSAFSYGYLTSISIPASVVSIGDEAFYENAWLTEVTFAEGSLCTSIGDRAFDRCFMESLVLPTNIASLGNMAFAESSITSIHIPSSLNSIGNGVFENCSGLQSVTFDDNIGFVEIKESMFSGCISLDAIEIPATIIDICDYAFNDCEELLTVTLKEGSILGSIGRYAFADCTSLVGFSFPSKGLGIGEGAFEYCEGFTFIDIPDNITSIGLGAFKGCDYLEEIYIPFVGNGSNKTHFGYIFGAETYTQNSNYVPSSLTTVKVGMKEYSIAANAFDSCSSLKNIYINYKQAKIGKSAFYGCSNLTTLIISNLDNRHFGYFFGANSYSNNSTYVPTTLNNIYILQDAAITDYAFYACPAIRYVSIMSHIDSIGSYAFAECTALANFYLTEEGVATTIGEAAFKGCLNLENVFLNDGITSFGDEIFMGCTTLSSIKLPANISTIPDDAFNGCINLTTVEMSETNNLTTIGMTAFNGCRELTYINLENVTFINIQAFLGCIALSGITLSSNLTDIGIEAFRNCHSIDTIVIPARVAVVGSAAFDGCNNLVIYCEAEIIPNMWDGSWNLSNCKTYLYSTATPPEGEDMYWHYVDGVITIWP